VGIIVGESRHVLSYLRFYSQNVAQPPCFISILLISLAERVDVVDADNPFVLFELDIAAEIVHMLDQRREDFSVSRFRFGAHQVNDMLCEVGIEFAFCFVGSIGAAVAVSRHDDVSPRFLV